VRDDTLPVSAAAFGVGRVVRCRPCRAVSAVSCGGCGRSSMVELQPSKLVMRVRFPSPAPVCSPFPILRSIGPGLGCLLGGKPANYDIFPDQSQSSNLVMLT
jgi:hypothetical protein